MRISADRASMLLLAAFVYFLPVVWAGTVPDETNILGVHPTDFLLTRLESSAGDGDRTILVEDSSGIDPRALLLLKSADGRIQEVHCVRSINGGRVRLTSRLRHDFPAGTLVIQASLIRDRGVVADLVQEGDDGSSMLTLGDASGLDALQQLVLKSPDGRTREAHCIRWVEGNRVRLVRDLRNDFLPGSQIIQGDLVGGELVKDSPCCCEGDGKCCVDRLIGNIVPPAPPPPPPLSVDCRGLQPSVVQGSSTRIQAVPSGADPAAVSYSWTIDGNPVAYSGPTLSVPADLAVGTHVLRAVVRAPDDRTASCEYRLTVDPRPNSDPVCDVIVNPQDVTAGEIVQVSSEASDPDNDPLTFSWTIDDQPRSETAASWALDTTALTGGSHLARVAVRDGRGGLCSRVGLFSVREKVVIQIDDRADNRAKAQLDEIALKLQGNPRLVAKMTGHTDSTGTESANQRVGMRRARLLREYLVRQHRIDPNRLEISSAGSAQPIASNLTAEGRQRNRRAEVEIYEP